MSETMPAVEAPTPAATAAAATGAAAAPGPPAPVRAPATGTPPAHGRRFSPLWQLTACRVKEFMREPEALFWVFAFPVLLAIALGLAFREKSPDRIPVAVVGDSPLSGAAQGANGSIFAANAATATAQLATALGRSPVLLVRVLPEAEARRALRTGKVSLLVLPGAPPVFRFDETRPDSRIARLEAGDAIERAAGRADPLPIKSERVVEKGARYIDFLIPGLLGLNLMGSGIWSLAFSITAARNRRILKRMVATPMRKSDFLLAQLLSRLVLLVPEVVALVALGWIVFGVTVQGSIACSARCRSAASGCSSPRASPPSRGRAACATW
jgi:ABC-2 type transport system permease protein